MAEAMQRRVSATAHDPRKVPEPPKINGEDKNRNIGWSQG